MFITNCHDFKGVYIYIYKKLYTLNTCSLLYINYIPIKLLKIEYSSP